MLAFACAFTMFAGAASFTDEADISENNRDAVELLTALNVIQGDPDGSFAPEREVTRAEMAKMIYVIRNGGNDNADAYKTVSTSFTDISGHWAEGYIKYLQNTGIVAGKSATRFDPDSTVTTGEAMKMALVLAGYRADKAGLTGTQWLNNTVSYATTYGLTKDVHSAIAGGCTRQDAAQILSNTLTEVNAVQWSEVTNSFLNDSEKGLAWGGDPITVGEKWMDLRIETGFITAVPSAKVNPKSISFTYENAKGEDVDVTFRNATADVADLMGYEVKVVWNDEDVTAADAIYGIYKTANNVSYEAVWKDIEKDGDKVKFDGKSYKLNGDQITVYADEDWSALDAYTWTSNNFNKDALSDTVVFIDNDGDGDLDAAQVKTQAVTQVTYVGSKNVTTKALVGNQDLYTFAYDTTADLSDVNVYEGIAKDDYVKVSYDVYTDKVTYEKLDVQTGTIEATRTNNTTKEIKIGGEWLKATLGYDGVDNLSAATGDTVEYVAIGNLIYNIKKTDGQWGSNSIAMIYNVATGAAGTLDANKIMADIIKRDGTTATVQVSKVDTNAATVANVGAVLGEMVTYRVVDGKYEFRTLNDTDNTAGFEHVVANDGNAYRTGDTRVGYYDGIEIADDAIVFVYDDNNTNSGTGTASHYTDNDAKVLTGAELKKATGVVFAKTVSAVDGDARNDKYLTNTTNNFEYVYGLVVKADTTNLVTTGSNYGYLLADASETNVGGTNYRVFNMWTEAGEITAYEETGDEFEYESGTVITYEVTSVKDGITYIKSVDVPDLTIGQVTAKDGNYVGLNGVKAELVNDSVVLNVNTDTVEGISGGDEARGQIALADVDANKLNVLFDVVNGEVVFMLIDTVNNEMVNAELNNVSAAILEKALAGAEAGETLTLTGTVPTGTFTVKSGVTLKAAATAVISAGTIVNAQPDATVIVAGNREMVGENSLSSTGTITLEVLADNRMQYTLSADAVLAGTLELAGNDALKGAYTLTGAAGAQVITYSSWSHNSDWKISLDGTADVALTTPDVIYSWNNAAQTWNWAANPA